jgi:hypothetical protein
MKKKEQEVSELVSTENSKPTSSDGDLFTTPDHLKVLISAILFISFMIHLRIP